MRLRFVAPIAFAAGCASFSANLAPTPDAGAEVIDSGTLDAGVDAAAAETAVPGQYAIALQNTAYVDVTDLDVPPDFTLEAWIRPSPNALSREQEILAKDRNGDSTTQCRLVLRGDNSIYFNATDASSDSHGLTSGNNTRQLASDPIDLGIWTHVAVTKQGTTTSLLINGKRVKQLSLNADFTIPASADVHFRIGSRYAPTGDGSDSTFLGEIDDVRVWNVGRTDTEIQSTMNAGALAADTVGLLADFPFSEGTGTTTVSTTGTHPATLVDAAWTLSTR